MDKQWPNLNTQDVFSFQCHSGVSCFNACCAHLTCYLSPYDVLRLRQVLQLSSNDFFARFADIKTDSDRLLPLVQLRMQDNAEGKCPWVGPKGCQVYANRPAACRMYPIGRGVSVDKKGTLIEKYILVRESHCHGFEADSSWDVFTWQASQSVKKYAHFDNIHVRFNTDFQTQLGKLPPNFFELSFFALYRLDELGTFLTNKEWFHNLAVTEQKKQALLQNEDERLSFAYVWLKAVCFDLDCAVLLNHVNHGDRL